MEILTYCIAAKIDFAQLEKSLLSRAGFVLEKNWQVLLLTQVEQQHFLYLFPNGTVVFWNVKRHQVDDYLKVIYPACVGRLKSLVFDGYNYALGEETSIRPHDFYNVDCLVLESDDPELKLSLSHGFSQSIKLKYFEEHVDKLCDSFSPYITELSQKGRIRLSRAETRQIIGKILAVKGELNITSNFLYQPKFFWQHPNLETYFTLLQNYLDISERKEALDDKLENLNHIFYMFEGYLGERHSHNLEIIIIVLIAIEIVFGVLNLHF